MSVEENKAIIRRWHEEILPEMRIEAFDEALDKSYTKHTGSDGPRSSTVQGLDQAKKHYQALYQDHPIDRLSIDDIIGEGDKVAVRYTAFDRDKLVGTGVGFYRFSSGKIVDHWYLFREP